MKNTDKKHENTEKFSKKCNYRNQKDTGMCLWKNPHSQCPQLPWTNLQMFRSDVTLNRPDLIYAYLLLFLLQVPVLSQMNDSAACGLTRATCISSKLILVKFLCSQAGKNRALWMTDAVRWWLSGGLCMLLIFLSQKNTIRGCFIKLSVQLFT